MDIFQRGDYRAFIVIAPASELDRALFAFPVFEGEEVSDVFNFYRYLYFPDAAILKMRSHQIDDPATLGTVFADVTVGADQFKISTITPRKALWIPCVKQWEDKWVFDHMMSHKGIAPPQERREFKGGMEVQDKVADSYGHYLQMYIWAACTAFLAWMVMSSTFEKRDN